MISLYRVVCMCAGLLAVKMFHLSAATCQDVPSLGRGSHAIFVESCVYVCWSPCCQDIPSLGSYLSRCSIFRQGESCYFCRELSICVLVSLLSRCSIFPCACNYCE